MKRETKLAKLAAILGLQEVHEQHVEQTKNLNKVIEVPESLIGDYRFAQGLIYFLKAPELFSPKTCKHCGEGFLVSRQYVAYCSYTCIRLSLEEVGIEWRKGRDIEALVKDPQVYDGQEPIWITNLPALERALRTLVPEKQDA